MAEGKPGVTYVDLLAFAADRSKATTTPLIWCLNQNAMPWSCGLYLEGIDPHVTAYDTLVKFGMGSAKVIHGTSWRLRENHLILQLAAVVPVEQLVIDEWPLAISVRAEDCGPEYEHDPTQPPRPSIRGVLYHTICGLKLEMRRDNGISRALVELDWHTPLEPFEELPARMYGGVYTSVVVP